MSLFFTRFRDMLNALFPMWRWRSPRVWHGIIGCLSLALVLPPPPQAHAQPPSKNEGKSKPAAPPTDQDDDEQPKPKNKAGASKAEEGVQAPDAAGADSADDQSLSRK